jgi:hypothetical protein
MATVPIRQNAAAAATPTLRGSEFRIDVNARLVT